MTTLTNSFHNTAISIKAGIGESISPSTYRKVLKALCGQSDCRCGGVRGGQFSIVEIEGETGRVVVQTSCCGGVNFHYSDCTGAK